MQKPQAPGRAALFFKSAKSPIQILIDPLHALFADGGIGWDSAVSRQL